MCPMDILYISCEERGGFTFQLSKHSIRAHVLAPNKSEK